jgi:hypothetical protein
MSLRAFIFVMGAMALAACGDDGDGAGAGGPDAGQPQLVLKRCTGRAFQGSPAGDFKHTTSDIISIGSVEHAGLDVLVTDRSAVTARAKFQYSTIFKDLEDEQLFATMRYLRKKYALP